MESGRSMETRICVSRLRYVRFMNNYTITVAGERRADLEDAIDRLHISVLSCGCLGFSGTLPRRLSQSLERALKTIDAELSERAEVHTVDDETMDSVWELLQRLGHTQTATG